MRNIYNFFCLSQSTIYSRKIAFNRLSRRKRGMASNPLFIICTRLFCIFLTNLAMAILGLNEVGKFLWEDREKVLPSWLSQFCKTKLRQPTVQIFSIPSQRNFPISFKPKVTIAKFIGKMQKSLVL